MDAYPRSIRMILSLVALVGATLGGCAGLPRFDPSGQRILIWPGEQPTAVAAPGAVAPPPAATFAPAGGNFTAPPVFTDQMAPGLGAGTTLMPQPFGPPAVVGPPVATVEGSPTTTTAQKVPPGWLGITPSRVLAPIGSEVVLRGAVCGTDGYLKTNRRVEWMLDRRGTGEIVTVGNRRELDMFRRVRDMPRKVDNSYVIGTTSPFYECIDRGTADPTDDLQIRAGESWISVTSPVEGTSYVTAYMPSVDDWNGRTARATIYWVDAEWTLPRSATLAPGERHTLTTTVTRQSDGTPLAGWIVRYTVRGGGAGLGYDAGTTIERRTDDGGRASVEVTPTDSQPGSTTINVEVIRPEQTTIESSPRVTLGGGDVTLTWSPGGAVGTLTPPGGGDTPTFTEPSPSDSFPPVDTGPPPADNRQPDLDLQVNLASLGPHEVGGRAQFETTIINRGDGTAEISQVTVNFDPGLKHAAAQPGEPFIKIVQPITLEPGESKALPLLDFEIVGAGRQTISISVDSNAPLPTVERAEVDVVQAAPPARPTLGVTVTGPTQLRQGEVAEFRIVIRNNSNVTAENVVVVNTYDQALQPSQSAPPMTQFSNGQIGWELGAIEANGQRDLILKSRCAEAAASACNRVEVIASPDVTVRDEKCLAIIAPLGGVPDGAAPVNDQGVSMTVNYPGGRTSVGGNSTVFIDVRNQTNQVQQNVALQVLIPPQLRVNLQEMRPRFAGETAQIAEGLVLRFPAVELAPGQPLSVAIQLSGVQAGQVNLKVRRIGTGLEPLERTVPVEIRDRL